MNRCIKRVCLALLFMVAIHLIMQKLGPMIHSIKRYVEVYSYGVQGQCQDEASLSAPTSFDAPFAFTTTPTGLTVNQSSATILNPVEMQATPLTSLDAVFGTPSGTEAIAYFPGLRIRFDFPCAFVPDSDGQPAYVDLKAVYSTKDEKARAFFAGGNDNITTFSSFSEAGPIGGTPLTIISNGSLEAGGGVAKYGQGMTNLYTIAISRRVDLDQQAAGSSDVIFSAEVFD